MKHLLAVAAACLSVIVAAPAAAADAHYRCTVHRQECYKYGCAQLDTSHILRLKIDPQSGHYLIVSGHDGFEGRAQVETHDGVKVYLLHRELALGGWAYREHDIDVVIRPDGFAADETIWIHGHEAVGYAGAAPGAKYRCDVQNAASSISR